MAFDYDDPYDHIQTLSYLYNLFPPGSPILGLFLSFIYWISLLPTFETLMVLRVYLIILFLPLTDYFLGILILSKVFIFFYVIFSISSLLISFWSSVICFQFLTEQLQMLVWQAIPTNSLTLQSPGSSSTSCHPLVNDTVIDPFYIAKNLGDVLHTYPFSLSTLNNLPSIVNSNS